MSWTLFLDHHVPGAVTTGLRGRGIDVITAEEDGSEELNDFELLRRSTELGRVLVSFDHDFLGIHSDCLREGISFHGIAFVSRRLPVRQLLEELEFFCQAAHEEDVFNRLTRFPLS